MWPRILLTSLAVRTPASFRSANQLHVGDRSSSKALPGTAAQVVEAVVASLACPFTRMAAGPLARDGARGAEQNGAESESGNDDEQPTTILVRVGVNEAADDPHDINGRDQGPNFLTCSFRS